MVSKQYAMAETLVKTALGAIPLGVKSNDIPGFIKMLTKGKGANNTGVIENILPGSTDIDDVVDCISKYIFASAKDTVFFLRIHEITTARDYAITALRSCGIQGDPTTWKEVI